MLSAGRGTRHWRDWAMVFTQHNFWSRWRSSALSGARREHGSGRVLATTELLLSMLRAFPSGRRADRSRCSEGWRGQARARPCEVPCRLQRVHCAGVAQDMGCNMFPGDRRLHFRRYYNVLGEDVLESGTRHGAACSIREEFGTAIPWADREPSPQSCCRLFPQRQNALAPALAHDMNA